MLEHLNGGASMKEKERGKNETENYIPIASSYIPSRKILGIGN